MTAVYNIMFENDKIVVKLLKKYNKLNDHEPARTLIVGEKLL